MKQNPYNPAHPASEHVFVGRSALRKSLVKGLLNSGVAFTLVGGPGIGKTSLLHAVKRELIAQNGNSHLGFVLVPVYIECMRKQKSIIDFQLSIVEGLSDALFERLGKRCPPNVLNAAQQHAQMGTQMEVIIDPMMDWAYEEEKHTHLPILLLDDLHRLRSCKEISDLASILQTAVNSQKISLVLSGTKVVADELRRDVSPFRAIISHHFSLAPFSHDETHDLVSMAWKYNWSVEEDCAVLAHELTKGHPYRLHYYLFAALLSDSKLTKESLNAQYSDETEQYLNNLLNTSYKQEWIEGIINLVRNDKLREAINELCENKDYIEAPLLDRQLSNLNSQERSGIITQEEAYVRRTRIASQILSHIEEISKRQ